MNGLLLAASVLLSWAQAEPPFDSFRINLGTESGVYTVAYDAGAATSYEIQDLEADTEYFVNIEGVDASGSTTGPEFSFRTKKNPRLPIVSGVREN